MHEEEIRREVEKEPGSYEEQGVNPDPDARNMAQFVYEQVKEIARVQIGHTAQFKEVREVQDQQTKTLADHTQMLTGQAEQLGELRQVQGQHTLVLSEQTKVLMTQTAFLHQLGATVNEHTTTLNQHTTTLNEHSATLNQHTTTLNQHTTTLNQHTTTLNEHSATLADILLKVEDIGRVMRDRPGDFLEVSAGQMSMNRQLQDVRTKQGVQGSRLDDTAVDAATANNKLDRILAHLGISEGE